MNNGYVHNQVLLRRAETHCRALGATIHREHPVKADRQRGAVDLLADFQTWQLVVEGENSPRRVAWDIQKASALGADILAILTPNCRVARACRRVLQQRPNPITTPTLSIYVLTLAAFHRWLDEYFHLFSGSFGCPNKNPLKPTTLPCATISKP
jgi:hypothetical protein